MNPQVAAKRRTSSALRRNVLTRGVDLNTLIRRTFSIQGIVFEGTEECLPLESLEDEMEPTRTPPPEPLVMHAERTLFARHRSLLHRHRVEGLEKLSRDGVPDLNLAVFAAHNQTRPIVVQRH